MKRFLFAMLFVFPALALSGCECQVRVETHIESKDNKRPGPE